MNSKQLNVLLGAIVIIAIGAVAYLAYGNSTKKVVNTDNTIASTLLNTNKSISNTDKTANSTQVSNLKTYTNSQYGFQFQYDPNKYNLEKDCKDNVGPAPEIEKCIVIVSSPKGYDCGETVCFDGFEVWIGNNSNNLSLTELLKKYFPEQYQNNHKPVKIVGYDGIDMLAGLGNHDIAFLKGNTFYDLVVNGTDGILSTFKF